MILGHGKFNGERSQYGSEATSGGGNREVHTFCTEHHIWWRTGGQHYDLKQYHKRFSVSEFEFSTRLRNQSNF